MPTIVRHGLRSPKKSLWARPKSSILLMFQRQTTAVGLSANSPFTPAVQPAEVQVVVVGVTPYRVKGVVGCGHHHLLANCKRNIADLIGHRKHTTLVGLRESGEVLPRFRLRAQDIPAHLILSAAGTEGPEPCAEIVSLGGSKWLWR